MAETAVLVPASERTARRDERAWLTRVSFGLLLVAWVGCYFPWTSTAGMAFSVNLFDLAEWTSLDPAVRGGSPPLLATFLLRATVGLIALALAIKVIDAPNRAVRWGLWALALLIGVGLLPPLDFFRGAFDDPNYRQQFVIALATVISLGAILLVERRGTVRVLSWIGSVILILAFIFGMIGALLGGQALDAFGLHLAPGPGIAFTGLALFLAFILSLRSHAIRLQRNS